MNVNKWIDRYLPSDLSDHTFLITGGNSGIGFELAKIIASKNGKLILAIRNISKGEEAKKQLLKINDKIDIQLLELDLADFDSIDRFTDYIIKNNIDIDYQKQWLLAPLKSINFQ